jgi:hypothetical protein
MAEQDGEPETRVNDPHDHFFRGVFCDPAHAAALLEAVLPPTVLARLDMATLRPKPGTFADRRLRGRRTDLLFDVSLDGQETLVFVLVEHQSTSDPLMAVRVHGYLARIWEQWLDEQSDDEESGPPRRVPAIVAVLVSHAIGGWSGPTTLTDAMALSAEERVRLRPLLPELRLVHLDLTRRSDARLVRRNAPPFARLGLLLLKHGRSADLLGRMQGWKALLWRVWRQKGPEAFERITRYTLTVADIPLKELGDLVERAAEPEAREVVMTTAERLRREGREQGRSEGREQGRSEGRKEGRKEGRSDVLLRLLTARFGALDVRVVERVQSARDEQLDGWIDRVLVAGSIDEVLAD